jgi:hypothetical protein
MDCEKFDSLILDELYGELDDLTSAAMKRHASGCAGCADKLRGFEKTREHSALSEPDFPPGLEERILSAALEAEKVVPIGGRSGLSRIVSLAGMWAMRPQTAMAALFLLMIGSSAVLLRTRQPKESAALTVTQEGAPSPAAVAANEEREFDGKGAAAAHGAAGAVPMATAAAAPIVAAAPGQMGRAMGGSAADEPAPALGQLAQAGGETKAEARKEKGGPTNQGQSTLGGGGGFGPNSPPPAAAPMPPAAKPADQQNRDDVSDPFASGMAAYQARRYPEATSKLDQSASQGNPAAALWAARSVREGSGCPAAVGRFNAVAARGGSAGNDATFDAARCYDAMGDHTAARSRYAALLGVPAYASRARAALDSSSEMASRKATAPAATATPPTGGVRAAPGKEAAPPRAPAPTSVDKAQSF